MYADLLKQEQARATLFQRELAERETEDVLDRALLKAKHAKLAGVLPSADYHRISEKVTSLKKLKFVEGYEQHQDKLMYEWIKYKVAERSVVKRSKKHLLSMKKSRLMRWASSNINCLKKKLHQSWIND